MWTKLDPTNMETWPDFESMKTYTGDWFYGTECLFQWETGEMFVGQLYGDLQECFEDGTPLKVQPMLGDWACDMVDVVAWMTLPEPYKGE